MTPTEKRKCPIFKDLRSGKILDKMLDMEEQQIVQRLDSLISELTTLRDEIAAGEPVFPDFAKELVDSGRCFGKASASAKPTCAGSCGMIEVLRRC